MDLAWYFCNCVVLMKLCCISKFVPSKPYGGLFIACHVECLVWHKLVTPCFIWRNTFQHCSDTLKLNKHSKPFITHYKQSMLKFLTLTINDQPTWMESNSRLPTCPKACKFMALWFMCQLTCLFFRF